MKILAIGDFHGEFPESLKREAKKVDLILSVGDYMPFSLRKEFFEYVYGKEDKELYEFIGKEKIKKAIFSDLKQGEKILGELNKLQIPVITVTGNSDHSKWQDASDSKTELKWKWPRQDFFSKVIKKYPNLKCIDYSYTKVGEFVFIGMARSTFPGKVKSQEYRRQRKLLDDLFRKFSNELKENKVIFLSHNVPYDTRLDLITSKEAHTKAKGKHYGSKLVRRIIQRYQPFLSVAGHIHERQGKSKLEKTILINTGAAHDNQAVLININEEKGIVNNIKFY